MQARNKLCRKLRECGPVCFILFLKFFPAAPNSHLIPLVFYYKATEQAPSSSKTTLDTIHLHITESD